jgi:hypothetical protein
MPNDFDKIVKASKSVTERGDPWEKAIQEVNGTIYSRWTKLPIEVENLYGTVWDSPSSRSRNIEEGKDLVTGAYDPAAKKISVTIRPGATWENFRKTLAHENIHAMLDGKYSDLYSMPEAIPRWDFFKSLFGGKPALDPAFPESAHKSVTGYPRPGDLAYNTFYESKRAGYGKYEIPAYMMSYEPGYLKDVTEKNAEEFTKRYLSTLPKDAGSKIAKMRESQKKPLPRTIDQALK